MLRFGTAIARLRAHQLDAYEGRACKEANLARGRQPVPIVDVDRCLHEKAFIAWFMAEEIQSGDQPLRAATVLWFRPPPLNRDSIRSCEVEMAPRGIWRAAAFKCFSIATSARRVADRRLKLLPIFMHFPSIVTVHFHPVGLAA
jgi:hypothetical protein